MKELNAHLKSGNFNKLYVFFGQEAYLIRAYEKRLITAIFGENPVDADISVFESDKFNINDIISAAETFPFLSARRLVVLKNSGLMQIGKKDASEKLAGYITDMPDTTIILFIETHKQPDKRSKLYKTVVSGGFSAEFTTPAESELVTWITKYLTSEGIGIKPGAAQALLRHIGIGSGEDGIMETLYTEVQKLAAFKNAGEIVDIYDIEQLCTQSIEGKIFSLVKEIGTKNLNALLSLSNLITLKEAPLMILGMIARQFRLMLMCKGLRDKGTTPSEISKISGLRDFMVNDYLRQGANFSESALINALSDVLDAEVNIKTGKMADRLAIETLIIKLSTL